MTQPSVISKISIIAPPRATIEILPEYMVDLKDKPTETTIAGLRLLTLEQQSLVKKLAPDAAKEYDVTLLEAQTRLYVSYGLCDANNLALPWKWFKRPQDQVFTHLTDAGCRHLFDALLKLQVETSSAYPEATAEDVQELFLRLNKGEFDRLIPSDASTFLRHMYFALDILREPEMPS